MKLKYAVIYQSLTGNTERIARTIYEAIESDMQDFTDAMDFSKQIQTRIETE